MFDIKFLINNADLVKERSKKRGADLDSLIDNIVSLDLERKSIIVKGENLKQFRNENSKKIGELKRNNQDIELLSKEIKDIGEQITRHDIHLKSVTDEMKEMILSIPNIVDEDTPVGCTDADNTILKHMGTKPEYSFNALNHWDIGENLNIIDFKRGAKVSQSRFSMLLNNGAKLERALSNFMIDKHVSNGYTEILPPLLVNTNSMQATGQLPKFKEDLFYIESDDLYLIPTSEVPLTNFFRDEVIDFKDKNSLNFCALTPCFRREAGSYGRDTRGLIRQHQFYKVELVKFTKPEHSEEELEKLLETAEGILKDLGLHYRVVRLCAGDLGFSSSKTYDIEVWLPGQQKYREISSCSNFRDFQAKRGNIKYKDENNNNGFVHTLNGSGLATGRTLVAVLENYQNEDGSITIPEVLRGYFNNETHLYKSENI